jgi:hypothetical protein
MERLSWLLEGVASGVPAVASCVVFLTFGLAAAWLLGLRTPLLLGVAAVPTGVGLLLVTSHVLGALGLQTPLVMNAAVSLAVAAMIAAAQWLRTRGVPAALPTAEPPSPLVWAGATIGALLAMGAWLAGIGDFGLPPQGNDDIWHGYLVERLTHMPMITAGDVAPVLADAAHPILYYPYGIHLSGAVIHEVTGVSVAETLNGTWVVQIGMLVPFGLAAVAWRLLPDRPWVAFWSGALSPGVTVFPYLTVGLLPYSAALAMTPGLLAVLLAFLDPRLRVPGVVLALAGVAVFVTHPAAALAAAVLAALVAIERVLRLAAPRDLRLAARRLLPPAALGVIGSIPWLLAGDAGGLTMPEPNPAVDGAASAVLMLLALASPWTPAQPALAMLVGAGVVTSIVSRRAMALTVGLVVFGALYVGVIAGVGAVAALTGPWYGGWPRLLAVVGLIVPLLAGLGIAGIVGLSRRFLTRRPMPRAPLLIAVLAVTVGSLASFGALYGVARGQSIVRTAWHSHGLVTSQDVRLLEAVADGLGPADRVLNSPRDGSTWMYAMFGTTPVLPYPYPYQATLPWSDLFSGKGQYVDARAVCRKLLETGATYAVVKDVPGYVDDFDIAGLVNRNSNLFSVILRADTGVLNRIDQGALTRCATE